MKILHLGFHNGLFNDLQYVSEQLELDMTYLKFTDGKTTGSAIYNIGHDRAKTAWNNFKDFYNRFDLIITSDTCPISRVFLQNKFKGTLIIWICNRFDYCDQASNRCGFPDSEYYQLLKDAKNNKNVKIFSYTKFEHIYTKNKGINIGELIIKPCGFISELFKKNNLSFKSENKIPNNIDLRKEFKRMQKEELKIKSNIEGIQDKLKNKNFLSKAPEDVVSENKDRLEGLNMNLEKIRESISLIEKLTNNE